MNKQGILWQPERKMAFSPLSMEGRQKDAGILR
jgi:hypothetical protein